MKFQVVIRLKDSQLVLYDKQHSSIKDIADTLGMKYQQVADISCGRVVPKFISTTFPFQPIININKISPENNIS